MIFTAADRKRYGLLARLQTYERLASTLGGHKARKRKGKRK